MKALLLALLTVSCAATARGPYEPLQESERDTVRAQRLSSEAAELIWDAPEDAEALLLDALTADVFFGPAHNNLGVLYLNRGDLYAAASEFEWARKLMPGHPDPRMNLALTLERAGQVDDAIQSYETALQVYPGHVATEQALARLLLQNGVADERIPEFLEEIAMRGESDAWRQWARRELTRYRR